MFRPLDHTTVRWRPVEGDGLEHLTLASHPAHGSGIRISSVVIGARGGSSYGVRYTIDCDAHWTTMALTLTTTTGHGLTLRSDGLGHWQDGDGRGLPDLDGCIDVDLEGTPVTNTLPIRRLALRPQDGSRGLDMLYIPFDTFAPRRDRQLYTCLSEGRLYRYEAADRSFSADLPLDPDGLVLDYPTLFTRV